MIRTSDDAAAARERLMSVFDLSEAQANYILDMQLRRLTKFCRIELETEQETLRREIEELDAILDDEALLRKVVSDELAEVAKTFGTPRRTVLLESAGTTVTAAAAPLEVADDPCYVFLSSTGLLARTSSDEPVGDGRRPRQARRGRLRGADHRPRRGRPAHQPRPAAQARRARPARAARPRPTTRNLQGGAPVSELVSLEPGERALALCRLATDGPGPGARHPQRRGQAGQPRGPGQGRVGGDPARRRRRGGRRASSWPPATRRSASSPPTRSCCTSPPTRSGRRAAPAAAWPASGWPPASRSRGSARSATAPTTGRGHRVRLLDRAARHRARRGQGDAVRASTRPRAGPPAACAATGSSRARTPLVFAWAGDAPARAAAASGAPIDLPEATGQARRLRHAGQPADRRLSPGPCARPAGPVASDA